MELIKSRNKNIRWRSCNNFVRNLFYMTSTCAIFSQVPSEKFLKSSGIIINTVVLILRSNSNLCNSVFVNLSVKLRECKFQALNEEQTKQISVYLMCPQGLTVCQK